MQPSSQICLDELFSLHSLSSHKTNTRQIKRLIRGLNERTLVGDPHARTSCCLRIALLLLKAQRPRRTSRTSRAAAPSAPRCCPTRTSSRRCWCAACRCPSLQPSTPRRPGSTRTSGSRRRRCSSSSTIAGSATFRRCSCSAAPSSSPSPLSCSRAASSCRPPSTFASCRCPSSTRCCSCHTHREPTTFWTRLSASSSCAVALG